MIDKIFRLALLLFLFLEQPALARKAENASPEAATRTNKVKAKGFPVSAYNVRGNTLLRRDLIDHIFTNAIGPDITLDQIRKALGELQLAYRERGYITVAINLPEQKLTDGVVVIDVTEAKLADIRIKGNRFYSTNNILRSLPSLHTNTLLNNKIFQRELDEANASRDRQIYPTIEPGPEPGTSALILKVKDRFPLHARADLDNYATPGTPELRINLAAQYNNLWQRDQQIGISYGFSPQDTKLPRLMTDYLFDDPLISYYGAYYRIPFGAAALEEEVSGSTRFGYNEATHQFILPPSGDRPDVTFYASASASDTGAKYGDLIGGTNQTGLLQTFSQASGRNFSINESLGGRFTLPFTVTDKIHWDLTGGWDYKRYALSIFSTNSAIYYYGPPASSGTAATNFSVVSASPRVKYAVDYYPVNLGSDFFESDNSGSTSLSLNGTFNFSGGSDNFALLAYSQKAREIFGKFNFTATRDQKLYAGWSALGRISAQAATGPLISNEQFSLGGINSVRGYYEGDDYGDSGWFGSLELRTPYFQTRVATIDDFVPAWARAALFVDYGQRYLQDTTPGISSARSLLGTGIALTGNINNHVDVRVTIAAPLLDTFNTRAYRPSAYFTIGAQF